MARSRELRFVFSGDDRDLKRAFRSVDKGVDGLGRKVGTFAKVGAAGFATFGAAAAAGLVLVGKASVDTATDINESLSKNQVLFGKHAKGIEKFASTSATAFGISKAAALDATGTFGNLFVALDIGPKKAADMSVGLTKLAADLASFNNASPEEALEAIRSGLVGETEPLRKFGVNLNDAALRQEALTQGLIKNTKEALTPQQKALAVNALLYKQTEKAQGDFSRTSDGLANQQRILKAEVSDLSGRFGTALLPAVTKVAQFLTKEVSPAARGVARDFEKLFKRDDIDLGEKIKLSSESVKKRFGPLARDIEREIKRANLGEKFGEAIEDAAPKIADAAAAAAPRAAGAFVRAFKNAGPWGQLITVAFLAQRMGAFGAAGRGASGLFVAGAKKALGGPLRQVFRTSASAAGTSAAASAAEAMAAQMPASVNARKGRLRSPFIAALKGIGTAAGIAAGAAAVGAFEQKIAEWGGAGSPGKQKETRDKMSGGLDPIETAKKNASDFFKDLIGRASGGAVPGTGRGDIVPAMLEPGEFVIQRKVVERFGPTFFNNLNRSGGIQRFAGGGIVPVPGFPGERAATSILDEIAGTVGRFPGLRLTDAYGPGHKSLGHTKYGTAADFAGPDKTMDAAVKYLASQGYTVLYDGRFGSKAWPGHGPSTVAGGNAHLHVEFGGAGSMGGGGTSASRSSGPSKSTLAARALKAFENKKILPLIRAASGPLRALGARSASLGSSLDAADGVFGRMQRRQDLTEEDLGTTAGRTARLFELSNLQNFKGSQIGVAKQRAAVIKKEIRRYRKLINDLNKAVEGKKVPAGAKGRARARIKTYQGRIADLKEELRGLGEQVEDLKIDVAELGKEITEAVNAEPTGAFGTLSGILENIDLREGAGELTAAQANEQRGLARAGFLFGKFGAFTENQRLQVLGDARQGSSSEPVRDTAAELAEAVKALKVSIDEQNSLAKSLASTSHAAAIGALSKWVDGEITAGWNQRRQSAGNGQPANY